MTFGLMGLFRRVLSGESKLLRYVSDSSYWLYVAHLPLVIAAQAYLREWPQAAVANFILVCIVICGFLLLTYEYLVRYTPIGTLLNGPRKRPPKTLADAGKSVVSVPETTLLPAGHEVLPPPRGGLTSLRRFK